MDHDKGGPTRREVIATIVPFSLAGARAMGSAVGHGPIEVDGVIRGLIVKRVHLGAGETLPAKYAGLPSATMYRPHGVREVVVSLGVTASMRAMMDRDDSICDTLGQERNEWEKFEGETLALIRAGG